MNTSATGGFLTPASTPAPLEDKELYEALQPTVVGVTGMDPTLVRPRWATDPALIPPEATAWCAMGVVDFESDTFPYTAMRSDGSYQLQRNEEFTMFCSFFDLGFGGQAARLASLLRDGLMIAQNREPLAALGIYLVSDASIEVEPTLFKQRWRVQADLRVRFRRQITRVYSVLGVLAAGVDLHTDDGQPTRIINPSSPENFFASDRSKLDGSDVLG